MFRDPIRDPQYIATRGLLRSGVRLDLRNKCYGMEGNCEIIRTVPSQHPDDDKLEVRRVLKSGGLSKRSVIVDRQQIIKALISGSREVVILPLDKAMVDGSSGRLYAGYSLSMKAVRDRIIGRAEKEGAFALSTMHDMIAAVLKREMRVDPVDHSTCEVRVSGRVWQQGEKLTAGNVLTLIKHMVNDFCTLGSELAQIHNELFADDLVYRDGAFHLQSQ